MGQYYLQKKYPKGRHPVVTLEDIKDFLIAIKILNEVLEKNRIVMVK